MPNEEVTRGSETGNGLCPPDIGKTLAPELVEVRTPETPVDAICKQLADEFHLHEGGMEGVDGLPMGGGRLSVRLGTPRMDEFFRSRPDLERAVPFLKGGGSTSARYRPVSPVVAQKLREARLAHLLVIRIIRVLITDAGEIILWHSMAELDSKFSNSWAVSAREIAHAAAKQWVRLTVDMDGGKYRGYLPTEDIPEPIWPDVPLEKLYAEAFGDNLVASPDDPAVAALLTAQEVGISI